MEFDWVMGCRLGWVVGPKFLLGDVLGWVGSVVWWVGLKKLDPRTTLRYVRRSSVQASTVLLPHIN